MLWLAPRRGGLVLCSVIRGMTHRAIQNDAVNLSQGFPDEPPPRALLRGAVAAILGGTPEVEAKYLEADKTNTAQAKTLPPGVLLEALVACRGSRDVFNQYSAPLGLPSLRQAVAEYYRRHYDVDVDPEQEITVCLGATEGMSTSLRATLRPGDGVCIMEPFHMMYVSQCQLFWLVPHYVSLHPPSFPTGTWSLDKNQLGKTLAKPSVKALILNSPHNPTGKVFNQQELDIICEMCIRHDIILITDEIYEHIVYHNTPHVCLLKNKEIRKRLLLVNSISKTFTATGWRIGWIISPPSRTSEIRAVHDNMAMQAPTPLQRGAEGILLLEPDFYDNLRSTYDRKRAMLGAALRSVGFEVTEPEGAYYFFVRYDRIPALANWSSKDAATYLVEKVKVATVQGDCFFSVDSPGRSLPYLRFAFCRSIPQLEEATRRLQVLKPTFTNK